MPFEEESMAGAMTMVKPLIASPAKQARRKRERVKRRFVGGSMVLGYSTMAIDGLGANLWPAE
jgi:hypothetical protein